ncbi:hypothetical protein H8B09_26395 [Paenibacillus sp. PR3]|uniref:Uncharacterized protein n=1 Tax=Paenibacillus terricola TaxID=2763503 RepID=A0ABR8N2B9_9BACL|nr:hypothetical protein [Paenibacillus terricola]MBD3922313.1 hypothetical protein [Paenibacillus terricola]
MTLITMKQTEFDSMSDERLSWVCVEPMLVSIRAKDAATKTQVIGSLNLSQQALCMFRVFYDHARSSAGEMYAWVAYMLQTPGYWIGVTKGLSYFGDDQMVQLLEDTRQVIEEHERKSEVESEFHPFRDLEQNPELANIAAQLYIRFQEIEQDSIKRISSFIRLNPQHFVQIEDEVVKEV